MACRASPSRWPESFEAEPSTPRPTFTDPFAHPLRVSTGAVPPFSLADGAGFTANRREFMLGVNLTLARNVIVGFEIVFNEEDFNQVRNVPGDVPNTFYMLRIGAEF
jgi:hypothetical protein